MKTFIKQNIKIISILLLITLVVFACHHKHANTKTGSEIIEVKSQNQNNTLYYSGVVAPLKTVVVTSPADGVISEMNFHYGDLVKSGQLLFSISSEKFQTDYKNALMQYIKAKTDFVNNQNQMQESDFLFKNQLISADDLKAKKLNFYNSQLALIQAKDALRNMLKQLNIKNLNLFNLQIEDIDKISKLLHNQANFQQLNVFAPRSGIILLANKDEGTDGELKQVNKGDEIKEGDLLGVIGDPSGVSVHINVSEFNINQLQLGQKVTVTGAAFPDFTLQGEIAGLNKQGQPSQGGLPVFPVEIIVPTLTTEQQQTIHMGMSAKVAINIGGKPEISVPIKAIIEKDGKTFVNLKDKNGNIREVAVTTGETSLDSVIVQTNLKEGDHIVVPG